MAKSQEQRVRDAANALREEDIYDAEDIVRIVLEAADRELPKWPTDGSVYRAYPNFVNLSGEDQRKRRDFLREAMIIDPIIDAAITLRDAAHGGASLGPRLTALVDAVNEAGL